MNAPLRHTPIPPVRARKTLSQYREEARARQVGRGISTPFLTVTEDELTEADLHLTVLSNPDAKRAQQDDFLRLYGVRRGDDRRVF